MPMKFPFRRFESLASRLLFLSIVLPFSLRAEVLDSVTFDIQEGWNAIYLPVTPTNSADEIFADWPVDKVGYYDQAAFLKTKQFETSADDTTLGAVPSGMQMWYRGDSGKNGFNALVANGIYVFCATADVKRVVRGVPAAMRVSWHATAGGKAPLNYVGISTDGNLATLTLDSYFQGLDTGWTLSKGVVRELWGYDESPTLDVFYGGVPKKGNLGVVVMDAAKVSDWSGVFHVAPMDGLNLGTNLCQGTLQVRNDSGTERQVRVTLTGAGLLMPKDVLFCDFARHGEWQTNFYANGYSRDLEPGETLSLRLAVDRTEFQGVPAGTEYGGILSVTDVSTNRPSHFMTKVPFSVKSDDGAFLRTRWPKGLWRTTLSFDEVAGTPAGSTMTMRILVHVDANGKMTLLQNARVNGRRLSSVVLPTDVPQVGGEGTFGAAATFAWTVAEHSNVNPFRHARHPDHDGLDASFKEKTPTGDDFENYNGEVKPELFSIGNALRLEWGTGTAAPWNPEETLSGTCLWELSNLRREGAIKVRGTFTMQHVSADDLN